MDGRSDFYGSGLVRTYQHVMSAQYDWESNLKRFGIEAVIVRPDAPIAAILKQSRNWKTLFDDGSVIIFRAQPAVGGTNGSCVSAGNGPDARNKLGVFGSSQVHGSNSTLKFQERRSL